MIPRNRPLDFLKTHFYFSAACGLEVILLTSGSRNVACEPNLNAFYNYSHHRLMWHAEADPAKPDSVNQKHEHLVLEHDCPILNWL